VGAGTSIAIFSPAQIVQQMVFAPVWSGGSHGRITIWIGIVQQKILTIDAKDDEADVKIE
jgi:hypothetical protein